VSTTQGTRKRMSTDARRRQLLDVAGELFARHPYGNVRIEDIAEYADTSLGLVYHYFTDKQALFAEVVEGAIEELGMATEPDPDLPPLDRLRAVLDGYLDYIEDHEYAYRTMHRGVQSGDARVRSAVERNTLRQIDRLSEGVMGTTDVPVKLQLAFRGWLSFVIATCLDWLENRQIQRDELRTLQIHALNGALTGAFTDQEPPDPFQSVLR
jgi:AcrR family transcriptional regulator